MNLKIKVCLTEFIASLLVLAFINPAEAKIQRSCTAYYQLEFVVRINSPHTTLPDYNRVHSSPPLGKFTAKGRCGNKLVANRCRRRARNAAYNCMLNYWQNRAISKIPTLCETNSVRGYSIRNLEDFIRNIAKSEYQKLGTETKRRIVGYQVLARTTGEKGCAKSQKLPTRYWGSILPYP